MSARGRILFFLLLCVPASAQNGKTILRRVAETYRTAQTYHYTAEVITGGAADSIDVYYETPDLLRVVSSALHRSVVLNDRYEKMEIEGKLRGVIAEAGGGALSAGRKLQALGQFGVSDYRELDHMPGPSLRRHETIPLGTDARDCFVVEVVDANDVKRTFWIDAERYYVLREVDSAKKAQRSLAVKSLEWNEPLDQAMFVIEAPDPHPAVPPGTVVINGKVVDPKDVIRSNWRVVSSHFAHDDGVTPPSHVRVTFPKGKERSGSPAIIAFNVTVGADGIPADVQPVGQVNRKLAAEAIEFMNMWRFTPARKDGQPVAVSGTIEVAFQPRPFLKLN